MAQQTLVLKLDAAEGRSLEQRLGEGPFEFRGVPHAQFSAKGEGVVVTLYSSGKLVVQGAQPETFILAYMPEQRMASSAAQGKPPAEKKAAAGAWLERPCTGSDETGKGDFLGPLVVCAVRLEPADAQALAESGVTDSKLLTDTRARELGAALSTRFPVAVERLHPPAYNAEYARAGNLNVMLAAAHGRALRAVAQAGDHVVVDRFGPDARMKAELKAHTGTFEQFPRAESRVPAVAAASCVARMVFLEALDELSEQFAVDLAKGAGDPVDRAARKFIQLHGREQLGEVAKLHFKNASRL